MIRKLLAAVKRLWPFALIFGTSSTEFEHVSDWELIPYRFHVEWFSPLNKGDPVIPTRNWAGTKDEP